MVVSGVVVNIVTGRLTTLEVGRVTLGQVAAGTLLGEGSPSGGEVTNAAVRE